MHPANPRSGPDLQDFSTFSFSNAATSAMPAYAACDPLDHHQHHQQAHHGVFDAYTQDSHEPCVPAPDAALYPQLTIDTSFMLESCWATTPASTTPLSSSPLSSVPGTPPTYPVMHDATVLDAGCHFLGGHAFDSDFLGLQPHPADSQQQAQQQQLSYPSYCDPAGVDVDVCAYGSAPQHDFSGVSVSVPVPAKGSDFAAFYGRQAVDPMGAGFAAPYMTLSTFAM